MAEANAGRVAPQHEGEVMPDRERLNRRRMQSLINKAAAAHTAAYYATTALNDECERVYGKAPSDIDCDDVLDAVLGGCGACPGMTVEAFDAAMRELLGADTDA